MASANLGTRFALGAGKKCHCRPGVFQTTPFRGSFKPLQPPWMTDRWPVQKRPFFPTHSSVKFYEIYPCDCSLQLPIFSCPHLALPPCNWWPLLVAIDAVEWGECQGSGSKPYQTQVDLSSGRT